MAQEIIKLNTQEAIDEAKVIVDDMASNSRIVVNSQPTFETAKEIMIKVKGVRKEVTEKKEAITKPLNEALKNTRALFKPIEDKLDLVEGWVKDQMLKYSQKLIAEQRKREEEALKKIEEATENDVEINTEKLAKSVERVAEKVEAIKTRKVKRLNIVDQEKIPRAYLVPDEAKIKQALLNGEKVAGCEIIEEEIAINSY